MEGSKTMVSSSRTNVYNWGAVCKWCSVRLVVDWMGIHQQGGMDPIREVSHRGLATQMRSVEQKGLKCANKLHLKHHGPCCPCYAATQGPPECAVHRGLEGVKKQPQ